MSEQRKLSIARYREVRKANASSTFTGFATAAGAPPLDARLRSTVISGVRVTFRCLELSDGSLPETDADAGAFAYVARAY
jgi:hypothetical protein